MFQKVVVAVDGSSHSRKAVQIAARLATGGQVVLVHSVESSAGDPGLADFADAEELGRPGEIGSDDDVTAQGGYAGQSAGEVVLEQARRDAEENGAASIDTVLTRGEPARHILKVAAEVRADAILVGSRGRSTIASLAFGSTSHKVLHLADRTCIVVR